MVVRRHDNRTHCFRNIFQESVSEFLGVCEMKRCFYVSVHSSLYLIYIFHLFECVISSYKFFLRLWSAIPVGRLFISRDGLHWTYLNKPRFTKVSTFLISVGQGIGVKSFLILTEICWSKILNSGTLRHGWVRVITREVLGKGLLEKDKYPTRTQTETLYRGRRTWRTSFMRRTSLPVMDLRYEVTIGLNEIGS